MTSSDQRRGSPAAPWDPGLQSERTALSWVRSALALLGVALAVVRATVTTAPVLAVALAVTSLPFVVYSLASATRRYRGANRRLAVRAPLPDGKLPALFATFTVAIGVCALASVCLA